jgi:hypothetical protein
VYNYTIVVSDTSGNEVSDIVFVTIVDTTSPILVSSPLDVQYSEAVTGNTLSWNATDNYPDTFEVYRNGTLTGDSGSWTNTGLININIDGLVKGIYNYTILLNDTSGNEVSDIVFVAVVDTTSPIFVFSPADLQYSEGTIGNTLSWNSTDTYPDTFVIYRNGSLTGDSGNWNNSDNIIINIDELLKGVHNYTIVIYDTSGNQESDTVFVTVVDIISPVFSIIPPDLQYSEGSVSNTLTWNTTDNHPATFEVYRNGTSTGDLGTWTNENLIIINIDGLPKGVYNYTIVIVDTTGNRGTDTVIVNVIDTVSPIFVLAPDNLQYSEGSISNNLSWNTTDNYPGTFIVYRNGTLTGDTGPWSNAGLITINVDGLVKGIYNYTIAVYDLSGNIASNTVIVTVMDTTYHLIQLICNIQKEPLETY